MKRPRSKLLRSLDLLRTRRGRQALRVHGIRTAHALVEPARRRLDQFTTPRVFCSCCGWRGRRFRTAYFQSYLRHNAQCPQCGSLERHRAYAAFYEEVEFPPDARTLYFAPEIALRNIIARRSGELVTTDLQGARHVAVRADMTRLPFSDGSFDVIIQHHVLEHVPDDVTALSELRRVLRPDGFLFITVPLDERLERTNDWGFPELTKEGHYRDYGRDFGDLLESGGFCWEQRDLVLDVEEVERRERGLMQREVMFVARAESENGTAGLRRLIPVR